MSLKRKILRAIAWVIGSLLGILLMLDAAIHFDQYLLRRKAERLLADIQSLELRKSTYADAQRVMDRWKDNVYEDGQCQKDLCDARIYLRDFAWKHREFLANHKSLVILYRMLGGRPALVSASLAVRNAVVWQKEIETEIEFPNRRDENGNMIYFTLIGQVGSGRVVGPALHPEYQRGRPGGCTYCVEGWVTFTPYADPGDVERLMQINLSCLTRWHPCKTREDILPTGWQEVHADNSAPLAEPTECGPGMIRVLSREVQRVAIEKIIKIEKSGDGSEISIQVEQDLKPGDFSQFLQESQLWVASPMQVQPGDRYVVFNDSLGGSSINEECSLVPMNAENMDVVKQGIAEDWQHLFTTSAMRPVGIPMWIGRPPD